MMERNMDQIFHAFYGVQERVQFYTALGFDLPMSNRNLVGRTIPILDAANVNECAIHRDMS
eukprot:scaffold11271_cov44-Cylindrotheca_fusiformis.AAC.1